MIKSETSLVKLETPHDNFDVSESEKYKPTEEQDKLIVEGIKLMGRRLLDLIETCLQNGVHLDYVMTFTHVTHKQWKRRLIEIHTQLKEWE